MVPNGQSQPQKNLPRTTVSTTVAMAQSSPVYRVRVVRMVPRATSGSSWRNQFTGQPRNCQKDCPKVLAIQNHINRIKKNTWAIRLTVVILIGFLPCGHAERTQGFKIRSPGPCLFSFGYEGQICRCFPQQGRPGRIGGNLIGADDHRVGLLEIGNRASGRSIGNHGEDSVQDDESRPYHKRKVFYERMYIRWKMFRLPPMNPYQFFMDIEAPLL